MPKLQGQGFLNKDTPHVACVAGDLPNHRQLLVWRDGHVHDLNLRIPQQFAHGVIDFRYSVKVGDLPGDLGRSGGNGYGGEAGVSVRLELYLPQDETGPDDADREVGASRRGYLVVEVKDHATSLSYTRTVLIIKSHFMNCFTRQVVL